MLSERVAVVTDVGRAKYSAHFYFLMPFTTKVLSPADSAHARQWIRAIYTRVESRKRRL